MRPKLTYANVMATVAVFIALGGASYAATQLPKNTVGSKQLKKNAVTTAKVKNQAVTGAKVKLSSLGTVPSAANAQTLGGRTSGQISEGSKLKCPSDMAVAAGICFETSARPAATLDAAAQNCGEINRALPSMGELVAYEAQAYTTPPMGEWVGQMYMDGGSFRGLIVKTAKGGALTTTAPLFNEPRAYRCVQFPSN